MLFNAISIDYFGIKTIPLSEEIFSELRFQTEMRRLVLSHCNSCETHYLISSKVISIGQLRIGQSALNDVLVECGNRVALERAFR